MRFRYDDFAGWSSLVARRAHNPEVVGSNPTPATNPRFAGRAQALGLLLSLRMSRVSNKPYFLYILWSVSAFRFYIGISEDPSLRLTKHNTGLSKWTAKYMPWEMALVESYGNYTDARKRELLLKKQKGGAGFYRLTGLEPSRFRKRPAQSGT
jgi:putative endonuclease